MLIYFRIDGLSIFPGANESIVKRFFVKSGTDSDECPVKNNVEILFSEG
jgi:hypothetical protein